MKISMITQFVSHFTISFAMYRMYRYLDNSALSTAASSSNRGIVCGFMGATLLLDIMNVHFIALLRVVPLR